jgi:septum formation protein
LKILSLPPLVLASASPRRAELLRAAGIEFDVMPANADETVHVGETPEAYARRVAEAKARAIVTRANGRPILAADTVVVVDEAILTKPVDDNDARRMLRLLSGRTHEVVTAVTLLVGGRMITEVASTTVEFVTLTDDEIEWYLASGEPRDKAGAYAIQGYASRFVTRVNGSYSNVVGLPVALVYEMVKSLDNQAR